MTFRFNRRPAVAMTYLITDRLHQDRAVLVTVDEIMPTVGRWLSQLDVSSPLVGDLGRTVRDGDWPAAHAIAERLSIDVSVAA